MMHAETSKTSSNRLSIRLLDHLPDDLVDDAAALYLSALADKLVPVYGIGPRARRALVRGFNRQMCITALDNDRLVGILGIQTDAMGFMNVTVNTLKPLYGTLGTLFGFRSSMVMIKFLI